jgi:surface antigen
VRPFGWNSSIAALLAVLLLAGCAVADYINENPQQAGAPIFGGAVGLAAGEAIGSGAAEAGLGAAGVIVGLAAGPYLQKRDLVFFDKAIDQAAVAEPGKPVHWSNPNTGTTGTMVRLKDVPGSSFDTCRQLRSEVNTGGRIAAEELVVCRPERGTWYIDSSWPVDPKPG